MSDGLDVDAIIHRPSLEDGILTLTIDLRK